MHHKGERQRDIEGERYLLVSHNAMSLNAEGLNSQSSHSPPKDICLEPADCLRFSIYDTANWCSVRIKNIPTTLTSVKEFSEVQCSKVWIVVCLFPPERERGKWPGIGKWEMTEAGWELVCFYFSQGGFFGRNP